jgi:hypothetical protein
MGHLYGIEYESMPQTAEWLLQPSRM